MKLMIASVDCAVEEGLGLFCVHSDSHMSNTEWQTFGLILGITGMIVTT